MAEQQTLTAEIDIPNNILRRVIQEVAPRRFTHEFLVFLRTRVLRQYPGSAVDYNFRNERGIQMINALFISRLELLDANAVRITLYGDSENRLSDIRSLVERTFEELAQAGGKRKRKGAAKKTQKKRKHSLRRRKNCFTR
jgi:hypothetical protein